MENGEMENKVESENCAADAIYPTHRRGGCLKALLLGLMLGLCIGCIGIALVTSWYTARAQGNLASYHHPLVVANGTAKILYVSAMSLTYSYCSPPLHETGALLPDTVRILSGERGVLRIPNATYARDDVFLIRATYYGPRRRFGLFTGSAPEIALKAVKFLELKTFAAKLTLDFEKKTPDIVILEEDLFPQDKIDEALPDLYIRPESRPWPPSKGVSAQATEQN